MVLLNTNRWLLILPVTSWRTANSSSESAGLEIRLQTSKDIWMFKSYQNHIIRLFSHSESILAVLYMLQILFLHQIPLSPLKFIQVQTAAWTPYEKYSSHPVRRQDQPSMISHPTSGSAAGGQTPCQKQQSAGCLQASVYQTDQTTAQLQASPD